MQKIKNKGFTLIELLIVVAIIGIMSAFFINTSTKNLQKSRDARRKTDLESIRAGIETYRSDCNVYPSSISFGGSLVGDNSTPNCLASNKYITTIPQDPTQGRSYVYSSNGTTYQICASLEASGGQPIACNGPFGPSNCGSAQCNYQATNP